MSLSFPNFKVISFDLDGSESDALLFFDDAYRNIVDAESIGVTAIHVRNGVNFPLVMEAVQGSSGEAIAG